MQYYIRNRAIYILTLEDCANIKDEGKNDGKKVAVHITALQRITSTRARTEIGIMLQRRYESCVLPILSYIKLQLIINKAISLSCSYS